MAEANDVDRRRGSWAAGKISAGTAHQVRAWCEERGWLVNESEKRIEESAYGTYTVPQLMIRSPSGAVYLEPVARDVAGARGRVDLLAWPSLTRMLLIRQRNRGTAPDRFRGRLARAVGPAHVEKIVGLINADLVICSIVKAELLYGAARSRDPVRR